MPNGEHPPQSNVLTRFNALQAQLNAQEQNVRSGSPTLQRFNTLQRSLQEPEPVTGPFQSTLAGIARGFIDPFTILRPVNEVSERLEQFAGDTPLSKVGYGLGFVGGMLIPGAAAYKAANVLVRSGGLAKFTIDAARAADAAADLNRVGKFTRGAIAGGLYSIGTDADNLEQKLAQVAGTAAFGGAGDVVIPAAWGALAGRFGNKQNKSIQDVLQAATEEGSRAGARVTEEGVQLHAKAMQLLDDLDSLTGTPDQQQAYQALRRQGLEVPADNITPDAQRRLNLQLGVESLNLPGMSPGHYRLIPTPHGDADQLVDILKRVEGLRTEKIKLPGQGEHIFAGLSETFDEGVLQELKRFGFVRGQDVIYRGSKWYVQSTGQFGKTVKLTQAGRDTPVTAKIPEVQFLSIVDDPGAPVSAGELLPLTARFVNKFGLWPSVAGRAGTGAITKQLKSIQEVPEAQTIGGFNEAFLEFATTEGLTTRQRRAVLDRLIRMQRDALRVEDPELGQTIDRLDSAVSRLSQEDLPDGPFEQLVADKGLTFERFMHNGEWNYILKAGDGQPISPLLPTEDDAISWVRSYGTDPGDALAGTGLPEAPIADNTIPGGAGQGSVPPHTAGELSNFKLGPVKSFISPVTPRAHFFRLAEDQMIQQGVVDDAGRALVRPYTEIFLPMTEGKNKFRSAQNFWLKGGSRRDPIENPNGEQVEGLLDIINPRKPKIRVERREQVFDLLESPRSAWGSRAQKLGLNAEEVETAGKIRTYLNRMFERHIRDENIDISFDDFIQNYMPHYRRLSDARAPRSLRAEFQRTGKRVNAPTMKFLSEMQRNGVLKKWERDPFMVLMQYTRAGLSKSYMRGPMQQARDAINRVPVVGADGTPNPAMNLLRENLVGYYNLLAPDQPEAYAAVNAAAGELAGMMGLDLNQQTQQKLVNTLITLNYGAFLGFRPGLALRNFSQTLLTTYPILGGKYTSRGLRATLADSRALREEMESVGALLPDHIPQPGQDLYHQDVHRISRSVEQGVDVLQRAQAGASRLTEIGMNWFTRADQINRAVAYSGMKSKVLDAWARWGRNNEWDTFWKKSGLNFFGPATKQEFRSRLEAEGTESAARFAGKLASDDSQWLYQLGAGPSMFSSSWGRLVGQYGTWPTWYRSYLAHGMRNLKGIDRGIFAARTAAVHKGIILAGAAAGLNLSRWTGLSSLEWMGGPAVDFFSDMRDIVTGVTEDQGATARRTMSLSKYGLQDTGSGLSLMPEFLGGRIGFRDPSPGDQNPGVRLVTSFFGNITPGYLAIKDLYAAGILPVAAPAFPGIEPADPLQNPGAALGNLLSVPPESAGVEWPEINMRE